MPKPKDFSRKSVRQTVDDFIAALRKAGGSAAYIEREELYLSRLLAFTDKHKLSQKLFNEEIINRYLISINVPILSSIDKTTNLKRRIQGIMRKMFHFSIDGVLVHIRRQSFVDNVSKHFKSVREQYIQYRTDEKTLEPRTMRLAVREISRFFCYLDDSNVHKVSDIQPRHINDYFKRSAHLAAATVGTKAYNIRELFRYLILQGKIEPSLLNAVPHIRYIRRSRLPDVWAEKDIEKLLSCIDRGSPLGKRDYALCLLIARLGLRVGDVRELCFNHINWNEAAITINQQKTKNPLKLPLPNDVGNAIIDYLQNGRPQTEGRHIFVLHNSPFCQFRQNENFHYIIDKYRRNAKITLPKECRRGFHSLRHSIATRLYESAVPIAAIASFLGHSSVETTRGYARVSIEMLRKAALEWEEEHK